MMDTENVATGDGGEAKKSRKRHKHLFSEIKKQMEFYFSDANLHKDRFIKKLMDKSEDKYVELSVFSKFNKLCALTKDMSLVAKALSSSDLLEVSADKLKVRRTRPLSDPKDVDDRTVYVECLPRTATHEWVKKIFQECGTVLYVSLPKYRTTKDIKGFGFVEFETAEQAEKACQLLHNPPADAEDKLGMFPRSNKQLKQLEHKARSQKIELPRDARDPRLARGGRRQRTVSESAVTETRFRARKRRRTTSEGSDSLRKSVSTESEPQAKQARHNPSAKARGTSTSSESGSHSEQEEDRVRRKRALDEGEVGEDPGKSGPKKVRISEKVQVEEGKEGAEDMEGTQRKRTRHRKRKRKTKEVSIKKEMPELRVIPKNEWSKLRAEYLQLQKSSMSQLKQQLHELKKETEMDTVDTNKAPKERKDIEFVPNVIIKVSSQKSLCRKTVKEAACKIADVVYADVREGSTEGYLRCSSETEARKLLDKDSDTFSYCLVQGTEEEKYWDKLKCDRENKLNRTSQVKQRGRDKLFKRAEKAQKLVPQQRTHVIFDDD